MRALITGGAGQLGRELAGLLPRRGWETVCASRQDTDVTDAALVRLALAESGADVVFHCAAWTAVDAAEEQAEECRRVNVLGSRNVAEACRESGSAMIYVSTDYVFDGGGARPWRPEDKCAPLSVYGQSKRDGELEVLRSLERYFIVRTSWLFGKNGHNFISAVLRAGRERDRVEVVDDQIGGPTYAADLAALLCDMAMTERYGVYHAANTGYCSRYELAAEAFRLTGTAAALVPVRTVDYPRHAPRPRNSRFAMDSLTAAGFALLPPWQDALARYLRETGEMA